MKRKAFVAQELCVACGCCVKVCPMGAIQIMKGIMAAVVLQKTISM
ncbi:MAG: 4Fe-4S binding protein [Clostridia bacterium]|nr:4Fe-4S binding protein [Clostridia bacterium]